MAAHPAEQAYPRRGDARTAVVWEALRALLEGRAAVRVLDVADAIHHELAARCTGAKVWGASAKFPGQRVGPAHVLADGDSVEILD